MAATTAPAGTVRWLCWSRFLSRPPEARRKRIADARPAYPRNSREPWRPQTKPPNKTERLARFLDRIRRQDDEVRAFMAEARRSQRCA